MTDEGSLWHIALGAAALQLDPGWRVAWLFTFAVGLVYAAAVVREKARQVFVPGAEV